MCVALGAWATDGFAEGDAGAVVVALEGDAIGTTRGTVVVVDAVLGMVVVVVVVGSASGAVVAVASGAVVVVVLGTVVVVVVDSVVVVVGLVVVDGALAPDVVVVVLAPEDAVFAETSTDAFAAVKDPVAEADPPDGPARRDPSLKRAASLRATPFTAAEIPENPDVTANRVTDKPATVSVTQ